MHVQCGLACGCAVLPAVTPAVLCALPHALLLLVTGSRRLHYHHVFSQRRNGYPHHSSLQRVQGRHKQPHALHGAVAGATQHQGQRYRAWQVGLLLAATGLAAAGAVRPVPHTVQSMWHAQPVETSTLTLHVDIPCAFWPHWMCEGIQRQQ